MALPFEPMHKKFVTVDGKHVMQTVPAIDDWENVGRSFTEDYTEGQSLEAGLQGRAKTLRSGGPSDENRLRQYHVNESSAKKRAKRESAKR